MTTPDTLATPGMPDCLFCRIVAGDIPSTRVHEDDLVIAIRDIARSEGIADAGYRVVSNVGRWGGQTVDHLHIHLMGGREFEWPPG